MPDPTNNQNNTPSPNTNETSGGEGPLTPNAFVRDVQKKREEMLFLAKAVMAVLNAMAYFMSYPALILFRRDLGERMLSKTALVATWLVIAFVATSSTVKLAYLLMLALPILYGVHAYQVKRRSKRGERHYSYSRGASWLDKLLPSRSEFNICFLEPLILLAVAVIVFVYADLFVVAQESGMMNRQAAFPRLFSFYLAGMGLGLYFVESRLRKQEREMLLTQIDQQIISAYLASALNDTAEIEDEGFAIAELANWSPKERRMLEASAFSSGSDLDPAWNNILDPAPGHPGTPGSVAMV
ncbi:MAG: hypothetical protein AAGI37_14170 [Planctomycetota bacterium]